MSQSKMPADEGFLSRWSRLKRESVDDEPQDELATIAEIDTPADMAEPPEPKILTDEDMPPVESLTEDSDYSGFMSPGVTDELRNLALRKLFRSAAFNVVDGLDDYDDDYTSFEKLGDIITADMRFQMEQEAKKKMQAMLEDEGMEAMQENDEPVEAAEENAQQVSALPVPEETGERHASLSVDVNQQLDKNGVVHE